jgi:precorrin-4 C11-methyltransferase
MSSPSIALIAVTRQGIEHARLLRQRLRAGDLYRPAGEEAPPQAWEHVFAGALSAQVPAWFARYQQLVFFLAAGAVTRLIAPCLVSKESDPGVLAIDEAGQFVIPLLSGHRGGANAFARTVAGCLGATPVVTTASDVLGGLSLDMLEDAFGWTAEPRSLLKDVAMALVNREPVAIVQEIGTRGTWLDEIDLPKNVTILADAAQLAERSFAKVMWVTDRSPRAAHAGAEPLAFRPKSLVLGVGCERGVSLDALEQGLCIFLQQHGYARASIDTLASVTVKADEPALLELAERHGWQTRFYAAEELAQVAGIATPSAVVEKCVGTPGVAEPAALLAAQTDRLLVAKQVIRVPSCPRAMTFALTRHAHFQVKSTTRAKVTFVGAGPGDPELITLKARRILGQAEVVIYAGSLIPEAMLRHVPATAGLHNSAYLTLEQVMEITLKAARSGRRVVRLHSGDTSIYSAIQEQIAILVKEAIDFDVVPGISSFQAVAAALRRELTLPEKVQTIILTRGEGNTPMPAQESLAALAQHQATLCIYLSARLADQVQAQLLTAYPPDTPVAIAYRVSWPDEQIVVTRLDQLAQQMHALGFVRTTLILVGAALGGGQQRSQLYDEKHGHIFRKRSACRDTPCEREQDDPAS